MATTAQTTTGTKLVRGAKHVYIERNGRERGPFNIKKIDGQHVTVTRLGSNSDDVIDMAGDEYAIVNVHNSSELAWRTGDILAQPASRGGKNPWTIQVLGSDLSDAHDMGAVDIGRGQATFHTGFADMAQYAAVRHNVQAWARDKFGGWVPAGDWRAVTEGVPCETRGCDRVAVRDKMCKAHASHADKRAAADAEHAAQSQARREAWKREASHRELCEAALERLKPVLAEMGIHPQTVVVGETSGRVGILLPAEAAELLVAKAVEGDMLASDMDLR